MSISPSGDCSHASHVADSFVNTFFVHLRGFIGLRRLIEREKLGEELQQILVEILNFASQQRTSSLHDCITDFPTIERKILGKVTDFALSKNAPIRNAFHVIVGKTNTSIKEILWDEPKICEDRC